MSEKIYYSLHKKNDIYCDEPPIIIYSTDSNSCIPVDDKYIKYKTIPDIGLMVDSCEDKLCTDTGCTRESYVPNCNANLMSNFNIKIYDTPPNMINSKKEMVHIELPEHNQTIWTDTDACLPNYTNNQSISYNRKCGPRILYSTYDTNDCKSLTNISNRHISSDIPNEFSSTCLNPETTNIINKYIICIGLVIFSAVLLAFLHYQSYIRRVKSTKELEDLQTLDEQKKLKEEEMRYEEMVYDINKNIQELPKKYKNLIITRPEL